MIEFSELRGPNKIFGSFCKINEPNILFGPLISENSIVTPPLVLYLVSRKKLRLNIFHYRWFTKLKPACKLRYNSKVNALHIFFIN